MCISSYADITFCDLDVDLEPMTLIYDVDLDILETYLRTNKEVCRSRL